MNIQPLLPLLIGGLVIGMVVMLLMVFRKNDEGKASERLEEINPTACDLHHRTMRSE